MIEINLSPDDSLDLKNFYRDISGKFSAVEMFDHGSSIFTFSLAIAEFAVTLNKALKEQNDFDDAFIKTIYLNFFKFCHENKSLIKLLWTLQKKYPQFLDDSYKNCD